MNKKIKFLLTINLFFLFYIFFTYKKLYLFENIENFNNNCYFTNNKYNDDECRRNHLYDHMKISIGDIY